MKDDEDVPIILGCPLLNTAQALVDESQNLPYERGMMR